MADAVYWSKRWNRVDVMEIRSLSHGDYEAVRQLIAQLHALHAENRPDVYCPTAAMPCETYEAWLADPKRLTLAAVEDGELLGFCVIHFRLIPDDPALQKRTVAYVEDLCVAQEYRRAGVGRRLFAAATEMCKQSGAQSLELMVWSFNDDAMRFYQAMGMTPRSVIMERRL